MMVISSIKEYELGEPAWAIEEKLTNHIIGYIRVSEISIKNKICKLKFKIGKEWANKGLIEEALENVGIEVPANAEFEEKNGTYIFTADMITNGNTVIGEALEKVIQYLFNKQDFSTIVSKFYDGNEWIKNIKTKVLRNVGMKQEAILRNRKVNTITGKTENLIVFSILKEEMKAKAI